MNQWNCYKRGQITLNEGLDFFCIRWNDCCGSRAVRQMTWQMTWCSTISIYSADPHIRKVSLQPNFYIYLSIKLIMHKHVQLIILIGKPCCCFLRQQWILKHNWFFCGFWTIKCKMGDLQNIVDKKDVNISNLHYVTVSTPKRFLYQST